MDIKISNLLPDIKPIPPLPGDHIKTEQKGEKSFGEILSQMLNSINQMQKNSAYLGNLLAAGEIDDLHTLMIESEKADLALQFTLQIRNKILDAYNEIMRMPI